MNNTDRILITLYVPASAKRYDIGVPRHIKIQKMKELLIDYLQIRNDGEYVPDQDAVLCDKDRETVLDPNSFVETSGLRKGSRVVLI